MTFLSRIFQQRFEANKPDALRSDILMISGCEDDQTSADVSNVSQFSLPNPAGRAGGACTSTFLNVMYSDGQANEDELTFVEVLEQMREELKAKEYTQVPQLTASQPIEVDEPFSFVPERFRGTRRAVLIGINYIGQQGQLSGCHNDVFNILEYITNVHGFEEDNITILMDDEEGRFERPTAENIIQAYRNIVEVAEPGDAVFCHYSGHGGKIRDDDHGEEDDGYDETLVPVDYQTSGQIRDDDLYEFLIKPMREDVFCLFIMDCCHSGTVLNLPYRFVPNENYDGMQIHENFDFKKYFAKFQQEHHPYYYDEDKEEEVQEEEEEEQEDYREEEEEAYVEDYEEDYEE